MFFHFLTILTPVGIGSFFLFKALKRYQEITRVPSYMSFSHRYDVVDITVDAGAALACYALAVFLTVRLP